MSSITQVSKSETKAAFINLSYDSSNLLGLNGPFAEEIQDFIPRPAQQKMADLVAQSFANDEVAVIEAGTGTGKTYAYLVPAFLSSKKVVISTATKNLQEQLFYRDLPRVRKILRAHKKVALLKGRSNYLCLERLQKARETELLSQRVVRDLAHIQHWSATTDMGDIVECDAVSENSPAWYYATSNVDNCLGQECPHYQDCFLVKARKKALAADLIVINHHLFFADVHVRDAGFGELLPNYDAVIFDEAHQIPDIASKFLGDGISARKLSLLARDTRIEVLSSAKDMLALIDCCEQLDLKLMQMRCCFGTDETKKGLWQDIVNKPDLQAAILAVSETLVELTQQLEQAAPRTLNLAKCYQRAQGLLDLFRLLTGETSSGFVHWYETTRRGFMITQTPIVLAPMMQRVMVEANANWVFTSATLAVGEDFSHFCELLGLQPQIQTKLASPFDYQQQSLLYIPLGLPLPSAPDYIAQVVAKAVPVIKASHGRTFFLFTSHAALKQAARLLASEIPYPLFIQGDQPKAALLAQFCAHGNAVLLGTSSFWEGVDVPGQTLSCVIIDKLPFASIGDPVQKGRLDDLRKRGIEPFNHYQLPQAALSLKQGAGRLIRSVTDKGVLMLCDPRLISRSYGQAFIASLPNIPLTRESSQVVVFLAKI